MMSACQETVQKCIEMVSEVSYLGPTERGEHERCVGCCLLVWGDVAHGPYLHYVTVTGQ